MGDIFVCTSPLFYWLLVDRKRGKMCVFIFLGIIFFQVVYKYFWFSLV